MLPALLTLVAAGLPAASVPAAQAPPRSRPSTRSRRRSQAPKYRPASSSPRPTSLPEVTPPAISGSSSRAMSPGCSASSAWPPHTEVLFPIVAGTAKDVYVEVLYRTLAGSILASGAIPCEVKTPRTVFVSNTADQLESWLSSRGGRVLDRAPVTAGRRPAAGPPAREPGRRTRPRPRPGRASQARQEPPAGAQEAPAALRRWSTPAERSSGDGMTTNASPIAAAHRHPRQV